ncbi:TPA: diguanylate cyclase [Aeromonas hydrophila]|jgi:diguanylate cyclase (GGDEF)-like protein|uniref:sensor domain-containing diguanylate cyclase n=1 Tax=Aeromonas hydrophila TaxID=644 RepID=UPI0004661E9B|nr:sensor domain-containing diguanylate cyclase [Aeromonas hydrophila]BDC82499.1 GGDEF domain-containing protein [Aeromonas hydrophila]HAT2490778.1 diguanylate cyclase [Aeromonas hydrophila]HAT2495508.1 diguanylate cyclase [Aeromonas hydrophila]HAT2510981.1 diguanylate cyclase [Aeromonas hydrophila]HAT2531429.1 diguanylate cyclase [Aeromonas hydrophila]
MGLSRHKLLLVAVSLLFLLSSGSSLYLQHRQEQLVDTFYRNIHWNISQVMLESQRFLYDLQLYRAGRLTMETLSLDYDLLWNRLDIFLISSETAEARQRHGLGKALAGLFEQIKQLEPQMEAGALREGAELARLQEAIASQTRLIEQIGDQILSGQERERSVSQIRSSLFWLQIWQLILLLTGGALVAALIRVNLANRRLALLDPLTRLGNRRALQEQLSRALHAGEASALVVLDLKRFKQVNDLLGYQVGDRLLQTVADKLQQAHGGHAYRLGGDEFAVVLTSADGALETRIHELVRLLHFEFVTRECSFDLACRLGVAKAQQQDAGRLLDQAILALNQAKRSQEGDICWFEPAMLQQLQLSQHQLHQLRDWLAGREPAPLRVALQGLTDGQGNDLWQMTLYWREQGAPCQMRWLQECGVLGPVLARLLQAHEAQHGDGRALLLPLDNQAQLAHVVAYLPGASRTPRVLLVTALLPDTVLLAGLRQQGCTLALRDIGSATLAQLAAGWPVRYWLPDDAEHSELLQPLARRLGLVQLQVLAGGEARQLA